MKISVLSLFASLAISVCAFGQASSSPSTQMVPYGGLTVSILLPDGKAVAETTADVEGKFAFSNLKPGSYVLKVRYHDVQAPRDVATGNATGKRQMATSPSGGSSSSSETTVYNSGVKTPRDAASGQASGKMASSQSTRPIPSAGVVTARETGTGMATGRRSSTAEAPEGSVSGSSSEPVQVTIIDPAAGARINTSRSNIKSQKAVSIGEGTTVVVDASGQLVGNLMKTKHDTVKNSINNVR